MLTLDSLADTLVNAVFKWLIVRLYSFINSGAIGGFLTHIAVPQDGKVIAITGAITTYSPNVNVFPIETAIAQLRIIVLNNSSDVQIYDVATSNIY